MISDSSAGTCLEFGAHQHLLLRRKLGRFPSKSLRAMLDYGLSDAEIGRYFAVTPSSVGRLRRVLVVTDRDAPARAPVAPVFCHAEAVESGFG